MDRLGERRQAALSAHRTLSEALAYAGDPGVKRDVSIERFEYTFEATWKLAQLVLTQSEGIGVGSPKAAFRASRDQGWLSDVEAEAALVMADDRNLTVHTYHEDLAKAVFARLPGHAELLSRWLQRLAGS